MSRYVFDEKEQARISDLVKNNTPEELDAMSTKVNRERREKDHAFRREIALIEEARSLRLNMAKASEILSSLSPAQRLALDQQIAAEKTKAQKVEPDPIESKEDVATPGT